MTTHPTRQPLRSTRMAGDSPQQPHLTVTGPRAGARAVVVLLHGGRVTGQDASRRGLAYLRMAPFARSIARATRGRDVAVWLLRYRVQGWNAPTLHPVQDAGWALEEARRLHPGAPIVLVGHSMGGRVALRLAGEPGVVGVCALAPWIEPGEPTPERGGPAALVAHGDRDEVTDPAMSAAYASRIGATYVAVPGEGHAMLRRPLFWTRLVTRYVQATLGAAAASPAEPGDAGAVAARGRARS